MATLRSFDQHTLVPARSTYVNAVSLGVASAETTNVPDGAKFVRIKRTTDVFVNFDAAAAVPSDVTNGTASILNPEGILNIDGVTYIGLISPAASIVTLEYFS